MQTTAEFATDYTPLLTPAEANELAEHETAVRSSDFVLRWADYGTARTDAPREFHLLQSYGLVATAIDRNRWLPFQHKAIYPSIYGLALADSGQRKSTPMLYAKAALSAEMKDRILHSDYSPEALIQDLSDRALVHGASRGTALIDEAGKLLRSMQRNHYGEGLKDTLSELWDSPSTLSRKLRKESFELTSVYVSVIMATTPVRFVELVKPEDVASGFIARFFPVLVRDRVARKSITVRPAEIETAERQLFADLAEMRKQLATEPRGLTPTPAATARIDKADCDLDAWGLRQFQREYLHPWSARLSEYVQRFSLIFAVSENAPQVDRPQVLRAVAAVDRAKEAALFLCDELCKTGQTRELDKVEAFVRTNPGITKREFQRKTNWSADKVELVAESLRTADRIRIEPGAKGTVRYYPVVHLAGS